MSPPPRPLHIVVGADPCARCGDPARLEVTSGRYCASCIDDLIRYGLALERAHEEIDARP